MGSEDFDSSLSFVNGIDDIEAYGFSFSVAIGPKDKE